MAPSETLDQLSCIPQRRRSTPLAKSAGQQPGSIEMVDLANPMLLQTDRTCPDMHIPQKRRIWSIQPTQSRGGVLRVFADWRL
jgi:hypothetical protein